MPVLFWRLSASLAIPRAYPGEEAAGSGSVRARARVRVRVRGGSGYCHGRGRSGPGPGSGSGIVRLRVGLHPVPFVYWGGGRVTVRDGEAQGWFASCTRTIRVLIRLGANQGLLDVAWHGQGTMARGLTYATLSITLNACNPDLDL